MFGRLKAKANVAESARPAPPHVVEALASLADTFALYATSDGWFFGFGSEDAGRLDTYVDVVLAQNLPDNDRENVALSMGAYLGELIVRHSDSHWGYDVERQSPTIALTNGLVGYPLYKVSKRMSIGPEHSLMQFYLASINPERPGDMKRMKRHYR
jgi:hypothetical protein